MNLVMIAAVIAVAGAAKLDRTYLPPASAKTAGGGAESLQTPFAANSLNQEQGAFPKGSFTNEFQGVVVDAALPGTRASGEGETGLGAPRTSYGSTNSKVGDAAFRGSPAGFRTPGNFPFTRTNQAADVNSAGTVQTPQEFFQKPGDSQGHEQGIGSQGLAQGHQDGFSRGQQNTQGFSQGPRDSQGHVSQGSQSLGQGSFGSQAVGANYQRSQALSARDREASIVRFDSNIGTDSYSYSFETDNGISAEENGIATNGVQAQGGYSYTGDDGQVYSVTYTADEGGYQPKGDHLPTPPPIPVEILKSLEQNARDEAAGQIDDGSYDAQKYNAEGDYTENVGANGEHNGRPPTLFGNRPESDATASGTFINQSNQPFVRPNALPGQGEETNTGSNIQGSNAFESSQNANGFQKIQNNIASINKQGNNVFGSTSNSNNFEQANETPVNRFQQNGRPHKEKPQESFTSQNVEIDDITTQGDDVHPNSQSFGRPNGFNQQDTSNGKPNNNNSFGSKIMNGNNFGQRQQTSQLGLGSKNEYLPPVNNYEQNRRLTTTTGQRPGSSTTTFSSQDTNKFSQNFSNLLPTSGQEVEDKSQSFTSTLGSSTGPQLNTQFGNFQNNKFSNGFKPNRFSSTQNLAQTPNDGKPEFDESDINRQTVNQNTGIAPLQPQKSTSQPLTELTTPFETSPNSQQNNAQTSANFAVFGTQPSQNLPTQPSNDNELQSNGISRFPTPTSASVSAFVSSSPAISGPNRPNSRPFDSNRDHIPQGQEFNQGNSFKQPQSQMRFPQNEAIDVQFASSTQKPTFSQNTQQPQGPDDSYYYNQPSKTFNTPNSQFQSSRFPSSASNQFNRIPQQSSFSSQISAQVSGSQQNFPVKPFGSQNGLTQGSTGQPIRPTFSSPVPTSATQDSTIAGYNGITQATASSFTSGAPTAASQFGLQNSFSGFGRKPTQQTYNQFNKQISSQSPSQAVQQTFSQQTTASPQSFSDVNRNQFGQQNSFQNQQTHVNQQSILNQADSSKDGFSNIPSQQYGGEIYEYNKPAQTLPPPDQKEPSIGSGHFDNKESSDRFSQSQDSQVSPTSQSESQSELQERPQFGSQQLRPQFGQKNQLNAQNTLSSTRPEFSSQSTSSFGNARPTQPGFIQSYDAQNSQQDNQFNVQGSTDEDTRPQFSQRPFGNNQPTQSSQFNQDSSNQQRPHFDQSRPRPPCCKTLPSAPQPTQGSSQDLSGHVQGQFGDRDSGISSQGFKPNQSSAQSFAGKGEVFGGPRKPPSFDDKTGYHY